MTTQQTNQNLNNETTVLTISLDQNRNVKLNILPPDAIGFQPQVWEILGMLESSIEIFKKAYFKSPE